MANELPGKVGSWGDLFAREHRAAVVVLNGGVALYAINVYLTTSLLPSAVAEIGGMPFYAWAMTVFLVASVFTSMLVSRMLTGHGPRRAYAAGTGLFLAGSVVAALAPNMAVLLAGRALQGLGGGLLAGLGFAVVRVALPQRLWQRSLGLLSAMWAVGNLGGPIIGGLFAEFGGWRLAFVLLAVWAAGLAWLAARTLPRQPVTGEVDGVPVLALTLVALGTAAVSVAGVVTDPLMSAGLLGLAVLLVGAFVAKERSAAAAARPSVLPAATYRRRARLRWIYLVLGVLAVGSTIETFLPLFGQRIGGLSPLGAGLLGGVMSFGWSIAQIVVSGVTRPALTRAFRIAGPVLLGLGLAAYTALQTMDPSPLVLTAWFIALPIAGAGIGMSFAFWVPAVMTSEPDPAEASKAAAGANTVQLISNAFGSAIAGLLVGLGGPAILGSARLLGYGYAALGLLGLLLALRALATGRTEREPVGRR